MNKNRILYINIILVIFLGIILGLILKPIISTPRAVKMQEMRPIRSAVVENAPKIYDIKNIKRYQPQVPPEKEAASLSEMYTNFPKEDVGDNMVKTWSNMKPEDKARFNELLDKEIVGSQDKLKADPKNKHAKNLLFISQALKQMAADGFDYKIKKSSSR